jgi:dihydroorotate dehydrogenase (fumarate)
MQSTLDALRGQHIVAAKQFNRVMLDDFIRLTQHIKSMEQNGHVFRDLQGKIMAPLFFENSSRTYSSFAAAMCKLGGSVVTLPIESSSIAKGESLSDTVSTMDCYADVFVLRHPSVAAIDTAVTVATHPVINAGNGSGEHPTQSLLDLVTIHSELGAIDGKSVMLVGDLKHGRTVHSLAKQLTNFRITALHLVAPVSLAMPQEIITCVQQAGVPCFVHESMPLDIVRSIDVIYVTRMQKERFESVDQYEQLRGTYVVNRDLLSVAKRDMIVMHPLPRNEELSTDVDNDYRAAYVRQMKNGLYARMALLLCVLGKADLIAAQVPPASSNCHVDLTFELLGHHFANPLMNAAGVLCTTADELRKLEDSYSGAMVTKSCTEAFREGNPSPRYHKLALGSINSMGLPNEGFDFYFEFAKKPTKKPLFFSVCGLTLDETRAMAKKLAQHPRISELILELNLSCPNVPGKPQIGYDMQAMKEYIAAVGEVFPRPFGVKLPPYFDIAHFDLAANVLNGFPNVVFLSCINSVGNGLMIDDTADATFIKPKLGFGGIGGEYVLPTALANVNAFFQRCPKKIIIGCGGIQRGVDAYQHILCGASLVQIGTCLYETGPSSFMRIADELRGCLAKRGYKHVHEALGRLKTLE